MIYRNYLERQSYKYIIYVIQADAMILPDAEDDDIMAFLNLIYKEDNRFCPYVIYFKVWFTLNSCTTKNPEALSELISMITGKKHLTKGKFINTIYILIMLCYFASSDITRYVQEGNNQNVSAVLYTVHYTCIVHNLVLYSCI